jgi:hypothetical protein
MLNSSFAQSFLHPRSEITGKRSQKIAYCTFVLTGFTRITRSSPSAFTEISRSRPSSGFTKSRLSDGIDSRSCSDSYMFLPRYFFLETLRTRRIISPRRTMLINEILDGQRGSLRSWRITARAKEYLAIVWGCGTQEQRHRFKRKHDNLKESMLEYQVRYSEYAKERKE